MKNLFADSVLGLAFEVISTLNFTKVDTAEAFHIAAFMCGYCRHHHHHHRYYHSVERLPGPLQWFRLYCESSPQNLLTCELTLFSPVSMQVSLLDTHAAVAGSFSQIQTPLMKWPAVCIVCLIPGLNTD